MPESVGAPAIVANDGSRRYVRNIVSERIDTKACMVETMPDRGEIDGGVLPKCNDRRTVCRKIISEGLRFFWLMFRGHGSKLVLGSRVENDDVRIDPGDRHILPYCLRLR
jgi:hypothetical protein